MTAPIWEIETIPCKRNDKPCPFCGAKPRVFMVNTMRFMRCVEANCPMHLILGERNGVHEVQWNSERYWESALRHAKTVDEALESAQIRATESYRRAVIAEEKLKTLAEAFKIIKEFKYEEFDDGDDDE